ncbi:MAG: hypothetical protein WC546_05760 [Candidatus Omnitrophota bacterium]
MHKVKPHGLTVVASLDSGFRFTAKPRTESHSFTPLQAWLSGARVKSQALLSVILLLTLVAIFIAGLTSTWRAEVKIHLNTRDSVLALYVAEAGLERAKIELANNWTWSGIASPAQFGQGTYTVSVNAVNPSKKNVIAIGKVRNCEKQLSINIQQTGVAPFFIYIQEPWSWREI